MTQDVGIEGIGQIAIAISDLERSLGFYRDVLGLRVLFQAPPGLAFLDCGGVRLMLTPQLGDPADHRTSVIYYRVDDIQAAVEAVRARGAEVEREPQVTAQVGETELWLAFLRDPDGALVGLMSEVPVS
jgi:methylmalonyl-CoA/ethylmalonyl-CoA epimerase